MAFTARKPGEFCWINILTPAPDAAREFFAALLGWTWFALPGMGHGIKVGDENIGALFDLDGPATPPGTPPGIGVMVRVASADETAGRATALGGTAKAAFDVGPSGRMAEVHDPTGANIDLWQPERNQGITADAMQHGVPSWFELMTSDAERARPFYEGLFGWTSAQTAMPTGMYTTFSDDGAFVAGMMQITPDMEPIPSHWGTYVTVTSADEIAEKAQALGGTLFVPVQDVPDVGRFCGVTSPQGVRFYAMQYPAS